MVVRHFNLVGFESFSVTNGRAKTGDVNFLFFCFVCFGFVYPTGFRVFPNGCFAKIIFVRGDRFAVVCDNREVESFYERKSIAYGKSCSGFRINPKLVASHMNVDIFVFTYLAVIVDIIADVSFFGNERTVTGSRRIQIEANAREHTVRSVYACDFNVFAFGNFLRGACRYRL